MIYSNCHLKINNPYEKKIVVVLKGWLGANILFLKFGVYNCSSAKATETLVDWDWLDFWDCTKSVPEADVTLDCLIWRWVVRDLKVAGLRTHLGSGNFYAKLEKHNWGNWKLNTRATVYLKRPNKGCEYQRSKRMGSFSWITEAWLPPQHFHF